MDNKFNDSNKFIKLLEIYSDKKEKKYLIDLFSELLERSDAIEKIFQLSLCEKGGSHNSWVNRDDKLNEDKKRIKSEIYNLYFNTIQRTIRINGKRLSYTIKKECLVELDTLDEKYICNNMFLESYFKECSENNRILISPTKYNFNMSKRELFNK